MFTIQRVAGSGKRKRPLVLGACTVIDPYSCIPSRWSNTLPGCPLTNVYEPLLIILSTYG